MQIINFELLKNPYNWVVVFLMVAIFALAWGAVDPLLTQSAQGEPV